MQHLPNSKNLPKVTLHCVAYLYNNRCCLWLWDFHSNVTMMLNEAIQCNTVGLIVGFIGAKTHGTICIPETSNQRKINGKANKCSTMAHFLYCY